jgi:hypothetical protein
VGDVSRKNNTDFAGKVRIYLTPNADPMGKEFLKDQVHDHRSALDHQREMQSTAPRSTPLGGRCRKVLGRSPGLRGVTGMKGCGEERIANDEKITNS